MEILKGHTSPETAYLVTDYPYGFRLRCNIRYWLEDHPKLGTRMVSQTSNPKRPGLVWNKPKASTYAYVAGCLYINGEDHVTWATLTEYSTGESSQAWYDTYHEGLSPASDARCLAWIRAKRKYEEAKARKEIDMMQRDNKTICQYCGKEKAGLSFYIGASKEPAWCMIEGTGKMCCPDCYGEATADGQAAIHRATGL